MSLDDLANLISFLGGLGLFIYGMHVMATGLQNSTGSKMQTMLKKITEKRWLAVLIGMAVTAIIQSSSATTVMVVGFVNAQVLNLNQAVGVIMGANIGTTITAWLVSMNQWGEVLNPEFYAPLFLAIGAFMIIMSKKDKMIDTGNIITGFGMLFVGLAFMSAAVEPYRSSPVFADAFVTLGSNPLLGILAGALVTGIVQSSSASIGILQTLALSGMVNTSAAVYIMLGQNIGTCVTAMLSSIGASRNGKRAAYIHLMFNTFGAVVFGVFGAIYFGLNPDIASSKISSVGISTFHTVFNLINTLALYPFANLLVKLSGMLVAKEANSMETEMERLNKALDYRLLDNPPFALAQTKNEVLRMGQKALDNVREVLLCLLTYQRDLRLAAEASGGTGNKAAKNKQASDQAVEEYDRAEEIFPDDLTDSSKSVSYDTEDTSADRASYSLDIIEEREKEINRMEELISAYLVQIENRDLNEQMYNQVSHLFYTINDFERIADHADNIAGLVAKMIEDEIPMSKKGVKHLQLISDATINCLENAILALSSGDMENVQKTLKLESAIDDLERELREAHLKRMVKGKCLIQAGVTFLDVISNLERISDHSVNIVGYVTEEKNRAHDPSLYRNATIPSALSLGSSSLPQDLMSGGKKTN